jgi:dinuclear metal center YbgI/SA1388 family protein
VVTCKELASYLDVLLQPSRFKDYCPNGLQVEGKAQISDIVTGVSANAALLDAAIAARADAIIVHHGYFWRGEPATLTGSRLARVRRLIVNDINLFAFHLPLDAHSELGNNAQLGQQLGLRVDSVFGENDLGVFCDLANALTLATLKQRLVHTLGREPQIYGPQDGALQIRRVGWCTGAAQSYFEAALEAGCDAFVSGEVSEQTVHAAIESGVPFIAAGHHATERYGVQALGSHLADRFGIGHTFIDIPNPL